MFSNPDLPANHFSAASRLCLLALTAALLAGCGASLLARKTDEETARKVAQSAVASSNTAASPDIGPAAPSPAPPAPDAVTRMLAYAERVRLMPPAELSQEVGRLGDIAAPASQLQLSLVLSQLRQLPELIRAQEALARVLANAGTEAQALHPLARLLAFRYGEQRRLEEQLERERQQTRDVQRRLDQAHERLEALKAIERSLVTRLPPPPAPVPSPATAPASRGRAAAP